MKNRSDISGMLQFDAHSVVSVAALPEKEELAIAFSPMGDEKGVVVVLPAGAVGHMIAQIKSQHEKLAMKSSTKETVFLPTKLTGAKPFQSGTGTPVLLLQFDNVFELAVELSIENGRALMGAIEQTLAPSTGGPPRRH